VAFHPPAGKPGDATAADVDENTWILAVVTKSYTQDKNRFAFDMLSTILKCTHSLSSYEVQDAEPQEDGQPGQ
jgi:SAGA-associated factor 29